MFSMPAFITFSRQSVRVLFNGRRWWYQPQALASERSGLVESPAVRFLVDLLRSHGYDSSLIPLWGKPVTVDSWRVGDLVVALDNTALQKREEPLDDYLSLVGVISEISSLSRRESGTVHVDFSNGGTKRLNVKSLVHTTFYHGHSVLEKNEPFQPASGKESRENPAMSQRHIVEDGLESLNESENDSASNCPFSSTVDLKRKLAPLSILDKAGMQ